MKSEIQKINDQEFGGFEGFPKTLSEAASRWATVVDTFASVVIPASTTASAAKSAFQGVMMGVDVNAGNGLIMLDNACVAYAAALAGGMAGAGFVGVPPVGLPGCPSVASIGLGGGSAESVADQLSTLIDTWFKTGQATPIAGGPPIPWS